MIEIRAARYPDDARIVEAIFREYIASPTVSLEFQDYEPEIAALPGKYAAPRGLLIFEEQPDHAFRLAARNDQVVLRANEGGQCDPFDPEDAADNGLSVKGRYFTVQNFVACGQHWSDYVTFRYDPRTHGWVFSNQIVTESFPLDDEPDHVTVTRADAHQPVSFGQWKRKD